MPQINNQSQSLRGLGGLSGLISPFMNALNKAAPQTQPQAQPVSAWSMLNRFGPLDRFREPSTRDILTSTYLRGPTNKSLPMGPGSAGGFFDRSQPVQNLPGKPRTRESNIPASVASSPSNNPLTGMLKRLTGSAPSREPVVKSTAGLAPKATLTGMLKRLTGSAPSKEPVVKSTAGLAPKSPPAKPAPKATPAAPAKTSPSVGKSPTPSKSPGTSTMSKESSRRVSTFLRTRRVAKQAALDLSGITDSISRATGLSQGATMGGLGGAGLGIPIGLLLALLSNEDEDGNKPYLRNMLLGGGLGALGGGLAGHFMGENTLRGLPLIGGLFGGKKPDAPPPPKKVDPPTKKSGPPTKKVAPSTPAQTSSDYEGSSPQKNLSGVGKAIGGGWSSGGWDNN